VNERLAGSRRPYDRAQLDESSVAPDPFAQFAAWLDEALSNDEIVEANAMTLATVDAAGQPDARIVLLRGFDPRGFAFFTNYQSRKGLELAERPRAALLFYWPQLERQVRIEGAVVRLSGEESDAYFAQRPRGHRLSAWASPQSREVGGRAALEAAMHEAEERFAGGDVPRPPHWGGFRVAGERFEFWQGRRDRVHDRIAYERGPSDRWRILRLAP
jgi:pyridoxamine 5'-phosphate oxidase